MRDHDLRRRVATELSWDPQIDGEAIEVSAAGGTVTLRADRGQPRAETGGRQGRSPRQVMAFGF